MRVVAVGVAATEREEAADWLGMATHRRRPRHALSALRALLAAPGVERQDRGAFIDCPLHFIRLPSDDISEDMWRRRMHSGVSIGEWAGTAENVLGSWSQRSVEVWFPAQPRPIRWASKRLMSARFRACRSRIDSTCFAKATSEPFSRASARRSTSKPTARS